MWEFFVPCRFLLGDFVFAEGWVGVGAGRPVRVVLDWGAPFKTSYEIAIEPAKN